MSWPEIDVTEKGAVLLGNEMVCDGFRHGYPYRFQTHIHDDHMDDFDTSKGYQDVLLHPATRDLLIAERNADLPYRANLIRVSPGEALGLESCRLITLGNGHMLGSVQVALELPTGTRLGYSGDFQWPLEQVVEVDALVVDSTYGSPTSRRGYSQEEVGARFIDLVRRQLRLGPVIVKAHRGTLQRSLELLDEAQIEPILSTGRLKREAHVYAQYGYSIPSLIAIESTESKDLLRSNRYLRLVSTRDAEVSDRSLGTRITLSAFLSRPDEPVLEVSERAYRVAMSGHADFDGTLEFVRASGARYVVTDNSRGGHGVDLSLALIDHLGIEARPSSQKVSREWGR